MGWRARIFLLIFWLWAGSLPASDSKLDRDTLRGLKAMYVIVAIEAHSGLSGPQIQADVVNRLRAAGIQIAEVNGTGELGRPCLFVTVNILKRHDGSWFYEASVALNQAVTIAASGASYMAGTWSVSALSVAMRSEGPESARMDIDTLTDKFVRAYLAANAR
jgi:hypothetical protein